MAQDASSSNRNRRWLWLLVLPFIATLWVPWYNRVDPELGGFPFFYWYQLLWVLISAVITALVYFKTKNKPRSGGQS